MSYIRKLPLLMGLAGAILTGLVGNINRVDNNRNMATMLVVMIALYIIGLLIRSTIKDSIETHKRKEQEREREKEEIRIEAEKKKREEAESAAKAKAELSSTIDLLADEELVSGLDENDFSNLPITEYIKSELKE